MAEKARGRFEATWDELESDVHVTVDDQVLTQDVSVTEPVAEPQQLDRLMGSGMAGGFPVS